jgi:hypothetical protein
VAEDISGRLSWLDASITSILGSQPGQMNQIQELYGQIEDISGALNQTIFPHLARHDASIGRLNDWLATASVSLVDMDNSLGIHAGHIRGLTVSFEYMDSSAAQLGGRVDVLNGLYSGLEMATNDISILNAATADLTASYTALTNRTRFVSTIGDPTNQTTAFSSALQIVAGTNEPRTYPNLSIISPATDASYFVDWTVGTAAFGIAKEMDVRIDTNCPAFTFLGVGGTRGLRLGVAAGEQMVLTGADLSINGNLFTTGLTCQTLSVNGPVTVNRSATSVRIVSGSEYANDRFTLDYANGDTYYYGTTLNANFSVSLTNLPTDISRVYTFRLTYSGAANITAIQANSTSGLIIESRTPLAFNGAAFSTINNLKTCEMTIIHRNSTTTNNFALARISRYATPT